MMQSEQAIFSVSKLNAQIKHSLESQFNRIWLEGEISNLMQASSGHWYFSLKDANAQIKCAMFKGANRQVKMQVSNGMQVLVKANVSMYAPRGDCQLIVESMQDAGLGKLQQAYHALKDKLANAGLFAAESKQTLPQHIQRVGIITSAKGAAIHDMLSILKRRAKHIQIDVYPTLVQGASATEDLLHKLYLAEQNPSLDVIIIGRGGGSLEDLWCFNDERLAQQIFNCKTPVISAVGHESDVTICDFVADIRAATPSAAAEIVSQNTLNLQAILPHLDDRLKRASTTHLSNWQHKLNQLSHQLNSVNPVTKIRLQAQRLDEIEYGLNNSTQLKLQLLNKRFNQLSHQLLQNAPHLKMEKAAANLASLQQRLTNQLEQKFSARQYALKALARELHAYSPLNTLSRGYSVTFDSNKKVILSSHGVKPGDQITTKVADGEITSCVKQITADKPTDQQT